MWYIIIVKRKRKKKKVKKNKKVLDKLLPVWYNKEKKERR